ncbi:alpha/beta fold hydrolase [Leucobacter sp. OH1287]|uniref:alpha/beta fold hydrolase n=1 Tax=Leucobacter sp. OH1287 TaxID=2491049 RepID=UPI0013153976|nr:alpha/beta fold hydrolase [Leucobacter sp. OH1287]
MRQGKRKAAAFIGATAALSVTFSSLTATAALANTDETDKQSQLSEVLAEHQLGPSQEPLVYSPDDPDFAEATEQLLKQVTNEQNQTEPAPQLPAGPVKTADVPDPLDFGSQPADPANYLIPASADLFKTGDGSYKIGRPTAGGPAAGAQVDGLADFYQQSIAWGSCKDFDPEGSNKYDRAGVECGYLIVPIDYKNPSGPTAAIALLKVPAKNQAEKIGTIFVDPGGPGGSGVSIAAGMSRAGGEVRDKFDIIGFDPRGVSSSLPMIRCKSSAAFDAQREGSDGLSADKQNQILKHNTDECYKNTGVAFGVNGENFIANVGTENVVRDLDIARAAVGDPKLNYLGFSYGTSIGYQYALKFPDNIRALVLDGVVNPLENNEEEAKKYEQYTANTGSGMSSELSQLQGFQSTFE